LTKGDGAGLQFVSGEAPRSGGLGHVPGPLVSGFARLHRLSGMVPVLVIVIIAGGLLSPSFLTVSNFAIVLKFTSVIGLISVGQTLVILSGRGGIDLSVGAVCALSGVSGALLQHYGIFAIVPMAIASGGFFGLINGFGVTNGRLQPFIVTLATMTIASGLAFYLSNAAPMWLDVNGFAAIQTGTIAWVPIPLVLFLIAVALGTIFLRYTVQGRELYAIGGNDEASRLSGIHVDRLRLLVYLLSGVLAGVASVVLMSFTQTADPNAAQGYELASIAAVVVGGTPLSGGQGSVLNSLVGVLIIAFVNNILILMNVSPWMQQMFTGFIVLIAVSLEARRATSASVTLRTRLQELLPLTITLLTGVAIVIWILKPLSLGGGAN
jgi:ribose transport system permease protein